jgi:hypothetical protein
LLLYSQSLASPSCCTSSSSWTLSIPTSFTCFPFSLNPQPSTLNPFIAAAKQETGENPTPTTKESVVYQVATSFKQCETRFGPVFLFGRFSHRKQTHTHTANKTKAVSKRRRLKCSFSNVFLKNKNCQNKEGNFGFFPDFWNRLSGEVPKKNLTWNGDCF